MARSTAAIWAGFIQRESVNTPSRAPLICAQKTLHDCAAAGEPCGEERGQGARTQHGTQLTRVGGTHLTPHVRALRARALVVIILNNFMLIKCGRRRLRLSRAGEAMWCSCMGSCVMLTNRHRSQVSSASSSPQALQDRPPRAPHQTPTPAPLSPCRPPCCGPCYIGCNP